MTGKRPAGRKKTARPSKKRTSSEPRNVTRDDKPARTQRTVRKDKPARGSRSVREERVREEKPVRGSRPVREEKPVRGSRPVREEKPVRGSRPLREEKPVRGSRPLREERPVRGSRPVREGKPVRASKSVREERPFRDDKPARSQAFERASKPSAFSFVKQEKEDKSCFIVDSLSALSEFAKYRPKAIRAIYCQQRLYSKMLASFPEHKAVLHQVGENAPTDAPAKAFWAEVNLQALSEAEFADKRRGRQKDVMVLVDHITDPRNLGAIARSAAFFGVQELVIAKDRQVGLTDAAVATSQGAFALTDLVQVTNLSRTLTTLKEEGYWIIGCTMEGEAVEKLAGRFEKVVLVLGSEDKGLSPLITKNCDVFVGIAGAAKRLDSLNVSVAAGILLRGFCLA